MAEQKDKPEKQPSPHEKVIRIVIEGKGGSDVIVALGASNHYTDHTGVSDTCCTCTT